MTKSAGILAVLATTLVVAGCGFRNHSDDGVAGNVGSDFVAAGGDLNLTDPLTGDAFVAGGRVAVATQVEGDLIAVGGEVSVGGAVGDDLKAMGGDVRVDAIVAGNARVAGGDVSVGPATVVEGAVSLSGGRVRFEGDARDGFRAAGGQVFLDGVVQGDAEVRADEVEIGPQARVTGKLVVHSVQAPVVAEGAVIEGGLEHRPAASGDFFEFERDGHTRVDVHGVGSALWMFGVFVAGTLFMLAFPGYSARAADWIGLEPLRSVGLGFVILVCLPILMLLLTITIIGIPLALILLFGYLLLLFLGWVTAALFLARKGLQLTGRTEPTSFGLRLATLLVAVFALWLAGRIPYVGGWISFVALLLGIGALVWQGWPRRGPNAPAATASTGRASPGAPEAV